MNCADKAKESELQQGVKQLYGSGVSARKSNTSFSLLIDSERQPPPRKSVFNASAEVQVMRGGVVEYQERGFMHKHNIGLSVLDDFKESFIVHPHVNEAPTISSNTPAPE